MKKIIYILLLCYFATPVHSQFNTNSPKVIINEIGLGTSPSDNFVELVILEDKLDLKGWQLDNYQDEDVQDLGYIEFSENFPQLPVGTPIFIYNDSGVNTFESVNPDFNQKLNQNGYFQIPFSSNLILKIDYNSQKESSSSRSSSNASWSDYLSFNSVKSGLFLKDQGRVVTHQVTWGFPYQTGSNIASFLNNSSLGAINTTTLSLAANSGCFTASSGYETGYNLGQVTITTPGRRNSTINHTFVTGIQTGGTIAIPFDISCSLVNMSEESASNGRASVTVSGGKLPLQVSVNGPLGANNPEIDQNDRIFTLASLSSGIYNITIMDANGCEEICSINIPTESDSDPTGSCGTDGIQIGRELTDNECGFEWDPTADLNDPESTITTVNLLPGETQTYTLTTSDGNGNIVSVETYTVSMDSEIQVGIEGLSERFCGEDMIFEALVSNYEDLEFTWNIEPEMEASGLSTQTLTIPSNSLSEGMPFSNNQFTITLDVVHPDGCEGRVSKTINTGQDLNVVISGESEICAFESTTLYAYGGESFLWNTGETSQSIEVSSGGLYSVVATTSSDCTGNATFFVTQSTEEDGDGDGICRDNDTDDSDPCKPGILIYIAGATNTCGGNSAVLDLTIYGGLAPYDILWRSSDGSATIFTEDTYTLTLTDPNGNWGVSVFDANGCDAEDYGEINFSDSPDTDGDGVCDDIDCAPNDSEIAAGLPCFDGDPCTSNDAYNSECECVGTLIPDCTACLTASSCDDNNACTYNDVFDTECNCQGTFISDCNLCEIGTPCDDGNDCTDQDRFVEDCGCVGRPIPDCDILNCTIGMSCDDSNPCTVDDVFNADCQCQGNPKFALSISKELFGTCLDNGYTLSIAEEYDSYQWFFEGLLISEEREISTTKSGWYTAEVIDKLGCSSSSEVLVEDLLVDDENLILSEDNHTCINGNSVELEVNSNYTEIIWFNPDGEIIGNQSIITVYESGQYQVNAITELGCDVNGIKEVSFAPFSISFNPEYPTTSCTYEEIELFIEGAPINATYLWENLETRDTYTTSSITYDNTGEYSVTVTDANNCSQVESIEIVDLSEENIESILIGENFKKIPIEITGTLKSSEPESTRNTSDCLLESNVIQNYRILHPDGGSEILLKEYLQDFIDPHCTCDEDVGGLFLENLCESTEYSIESLLEYSSTLDGGAIEAYIVDDANGSFLFLRNSLVPNCSPYDPIVLGGFSGALNELICANFNSEKVTLSYSSEGVLDLYSGINRMFDGKFYTTTSNIIQGVHMGNYRFGEEVDLSDPEKVQIVEKTNWCSYKPVSILGIVYEEENIQGEYLEISIPYVETCYGRLTITVQNYDSENWGTVEEFAQFFDKSIIKNKVTEIVIRSIEEGNFDYFDKLPICLIHENLICDLFVDHFLSSTSGNFYSRRSAAKHLLSTENVNHASQIIDCFKDNNLVKPYREDLFGSYFYKVKFLKSLVRLYFLSGNKYEDHIEDENYFRLESGTPKAGFVSIHHTNAVGYESNDLTVSKSTIRNQVLEPGWVAEDPVGIDNINFNYFDTYPIRVSKEMDFVGFGSPEILEKVDVKLPGIYMAFAIENYNKENFQENLSLAINIASILIPFGQIISGPQRLVSLANLFRLAEIANGTAHLFLENTSICDKDDSIGPEFCDAAKNVLFYFDLLLLTGDFIPSTNALQQKAKMAEVYNTNSTVKQKVDDVIKNGDNGPEGIKKVQDFQNFLNDSDDMFHLLNETFEEIGELAVPNIWQTVVNHPDLAQYAHKFLDLKNEINALSTTAGHQFVQDVLNSMVPANGLGKNIDKLNDYGLESWKRFNAVPEAHELKLNYDWIAKLSDDLSNPKWGPGIENLLDANPSDVVDIWKELKDNPAFHWEIYDDGAGFASGSRWEKWSAREFFKHVTKAGKDFEEIVTEIAKNGSKPPFDQWLANGYKHHGQLHIVNVEQGKKIIGDDVFIIEDIDQMGMTFYRGIYHDSKLSSGSPWTPNQKSELINIFKNDPSKMYIEFEVRTANSNLPSGSPVAQGDKIRIYRDDVYKSISNGSGLHDSTNKVF